MDINEWRLMNLYADVEVFRSILARLLIETQSDSWVALLLEELEVPEVGSDPFTQVSNAALDRMAQRIAELRGRGSTG